MTSPDLGLTGTGGGAGSGHMGAEGVACEDSGLAGVVGGDKMAEFLDLCCWAGGGAVGAGVLCLER